MRLRGIVFFALLFCFLPTFAQVPAEHAAIVQRLADYGRLSMQWRVDSLLEFIDPQLFEIVPRETMRASFETIMADENMEVGFENFTVRNIGETVTVRGTEYCPVTYQITMTLRMLSEEYREEAFMRLIAETTGGEHSVDPATHTLALVKHKLLFAIRHRPAEPWYFVEYQPDNTAIIDLVVPPAVREQLNLKQ